MDKLLLTPEEAADVLAISRSKFYELLSRQEIPSVRIDGCRRIPASVLHAYVEALLTDDHQSGALPSGR
jgi:excisionase family DNA binding protein